MTDPWLDLRWLWVPGTAMGIFGGLWGSLVGVLAPRGRARALVIGIWWTGVVASALLLAAGLAALGGGQPRMVAWALGQPGLIGLALLLGLRGPMQAAYRQAEARKIEARDLEP